MHRLVSGPPASGKSTAVLDLFHARQDSLLLVPTATMAEHLRHSLTRAGIAIRPGRIRTLGQFLDLLSPLAAAPDALVSLLLERSLEQSPPPRFREVADQPGFVGALVRLFAEAPPTRLPADLGRLFTEAQQELTLRGMAGRHARVDAAVHTIQELPSNEVLGGELPKLILVDGFFKFSNGEQALLIALAQQTEMVVTLPESHGAEPARNALLAANFELTTLTGIPAARAATELVIFHAETIEAEVEEIARRILEYIAADPARRFREVGIVLRSRDPYGPLMETTLARFGIPTRSYFTNPVARHPAIAYLSKLVQAMLSGWDHELLLEALRMPVSGVGATSAGDAFDFALRERIPGYGLPIRWKKRNKHDKLPPLPAILDRLAEWDSSRRDALAPAEWAVRLKRLTGLLPAPMVANAASRDQVQAWRSTSAALNAFALALENTATALENAGSLPLRAFWNQLETTLNLEQLRVPDDRRNVVHLLDAYEARQWELPVVFVCGMTERHFPQYHQQDPILPDADRRRAGLDTSVDHQQDEAFLFQLTTTRATKQTILSYPKFDEKGDRTLPSFFLETDPWANIDHRTAAPRSVVSPREDSLLRKPHVSSTAKSIAHNRLSASSVESFLQCPFQFFTRKTLFLRQRPKAPRDRLDNLLQGTILHEALAEWTRAPLLNADVLDQVFEQYCFRERVPRTYRAEAVRLELKRHFTAFIGDQNVDPKGWSREVEASFEFSLTPTLAIRGRIDRMDVSPNGDVLVIDYKYSAADKIKGHITGSEAGEKVQGGLYLLAAQRHFGYRPAGMLFCGLRKSVTWDGWHNGIAGLEEIGEKYTSDGLMELVQRTEQTVQDAHAEILAGNIAPHPLDDSKCRWCEARDICRIETQDATVQTSGGSV